GLGRRVERGGAGFLTPYRPVAAQPWGSGSDRGSGSHRPQTAGLAAGARPPAGHLQVADLARSIVRAAEDAAAGEQARTDAESDVDVDGVDFVQTGEALLSSGHSVDVVVDDYRPAQRRLQQVSERHVCPAEVGRCTDGPRLDVDNADGAHSDPAPRAHGPTLPGDDSPCPRRHAPDGFGGGLATIHR